MISESALHWHDLPTPVIAQLRHGAVIPAHPLALGPDRKFDRDSQRAISRYYVDAGSGGLAVGVHTTQFAIRDPKVGLYQAVLELARETAQEAIRPGRPTPKPTPDPTRASKRKPRNSRGQGVVMDEAKRSDEFVMVAGVCGRTAQALAGLVGGVTTVDLTVTDIYAADTIADDVQAATGVQADSWIKTNAQFFTAIHAQQYSNTLIRVFVGLSVAFGIASVLVVSVIQRSKDIGILRAMGTSRGQILRVFLLQGGLLGFLGSVVGAAAGVAAVVIWHAYLRQPDGSEVFPLVIEPTLFVYSVLLAALTGVAAAAVPALRAANLDPVVAIRG